MASPRETVPSTTTRALMPRRDSSMPVGEFTKRNASTTEAGGELRASPMWLIGDLDDRGAQLQASPRREVLRSEREVDVQLIAREWPSIPVAGDERGGARAHDVELHVGMGPTVDRTRGRPIEPRIADKPAHLVELGDLEHFTLIDSGTAHDQLQGSRVERRLPDARHAALELGRREMSHPPMFADDPCAFRGFAGSSRQAPRRPRA